MRKPDYLKLKCPQCGNTEEFLEFADAATEQRFTVKDGKIDWSVTELLDEPNQPDIVICGRGHHPDEILWRNPVSDPPVDEPCDFPECERLAVSGGKYCMDHTRSPKHGDLWRERESVGKQ